MATTPIYGKRSLNIFFSETKWPLALGLGMCHWGCRPYQVCTNDDSRLTLNYFMARSNLIPNAFIWKKSLNVHFSITVQAEFIIDKLNETMVKCQADLRPFIQSHSFGLPLPYLNIFFSEITGLFYGLFIRLFRSLDQNDCNPRKW